jgi:predicted GIY-YIG superfamily endonuclease
VGFTNDVNRRLVEHNITEPKGLNDQKLTIRINMKKE